MGCTNSKNEVNNGHIRHTYQPQHQATRNNYEVIESHNDEPQAQFNAPTERMQSFYDKWGIKNESEFVPQTTLEKIAFLSDRLKTRKVPFLDGCNVLKINRENIIDNSIEQFMQFDHHKVRIRRI